MAQTETTALESYINVPPDGGSLPTPTELDGNDFVPQLFCPVCCSVVDAERWGPQALECGNCTTSFLVVLDKSTVLTHQAT